MNKKQFEIFADQIREIWYDIIGYRKRGALGDETENTRTVKFSSVPTKGLRENDEIDLSGGVESSQGWRGSCACTTLGGGVCQDWAIAKTRDKTLEIKWLEAWENMKKMKIADDQEGSYLEDNIWYAKEIGYKDNKGNTWKIDKVEKIAQKDCEKYLRMGYQIYTASYCGSPMCDNQWFFRTGHRDFGHSFRKIGVKLITDIKVCLNETTWKNYGYKKESQFYSFFEDDRKLMSCYVMSWKKV